MKTQSYLKIIQKSFISSELELEGAFIVDRKLRLMMNENPELSESRNQLRTIIKEYENKNWSKNTIITNEKMALSDFKWVKKFLP